MVEKVWVGHIPDPAEASIGRVVLTDGTLVTTWDWAGHGTSLWSGKHRDTGFNLQVAATPASDLITVSTPVPGSWHDVHTWNDSAFPKAFADRESIGDLGYLGTGCSPAAASHPHENDPWPTRTSTSPSAGSAPPWNGP
nr:transposase family protein [Streptomyces sp. 3211]